MTLVSRKPLTPTHPHGHVLARRDGALGLVRISKNASTESKARLECRDWKPFEGFEGPVVAFLREPVSRFVSGVPETLLRMTHYVVADSSRLDRVEAPEDVYSELIEVAQQPVEVVFERFLDLVEYAFFDAHHEPQHAFFTNRQLMLRVDPLLYLTEDFETAISQIEERTGIAALAPSERGNRGGAKPKAGRNRAIDVARRITRSGVHRHIDHSGFLGTRYRGAPESMRLSDLNGLANRFAREIKQFEVPAALQERITTLYDLDQRLWLRVKAEGGNVRASEIWQDLVSGKSA